MPDLHLALPEWHLAASEIYLSAPESHLAPPEWQVTPSKSLFIVSIQSLNNYLKLWKEKADTAIKGEAKKNMIDTVLKVAAGMAAHAASTGDIRLKMTAAVSHSKLDDMRETNFVNEVRTIYDAALTVAAGLAEWGVKQSDISVLNTSSDEYLRKSATIHNVKVKAKQATSDLKANFDKALTHIKTTLDAKMLPFKTLNPSFHGEYLNARVIIDLAGGHAAAPVDTKPVELTTH